MANTVYTMETRAPARNPKGEFFAMAERPLSSARDPYSPDELCAAGEFQNLGRDGEGLPAWTRANRSITDADVVLWYTLGITHVPRPEDWPYMPAHRGPFRLVPTSFFSRNPTLDVPATGR